jgi:Protein of unknown function (DUF2934)
MALPIQTPVQSESPEQSPANPPTYEQIELRAYQLWLDRTASGLAGNAEGDWLTAEQLLSNAGGNAEGG